MMGVGSAPLCTDRYERVFWLGDLNYRVAGNRAMIDALIRQNMLEVMRSNDQLVNEMKASRVFNGFIEATINFPPTYKFDPKTDIYDSSKKQRIPSWTDRILYKSHRAIRLREYNRFVHSIV
jgi:hypothetical protein